MKSYKTLLVLAALVSASFAFAEDTKKAAPAAEPHKSKCCAKAAAAGETCKHECCTAAAKDGKNCEKCGGTNAPAGK